MEILMKKGSGKRYVLCTGKCFCWWHRGKSNRSLTQSFLIDVIWLAWQQLKLFTSIFVMSCSCTIRKWNYKHLRKRQTKKKMREDFWSNLKFNIFVHFRLNNRDTFLFTNQFSCSWCPFFTFLSNFTSAALYLSKEDCVLTKTFSDFLTICMWNVVSCRFSSRLHFVPCLYLLTPLSPSPSPSLLCSLVHNSKAQSDIIF